MKDILQHTNLICHCITSQNDILSNEHRPERGRLTFINEKVIQYQIVQALCSHGKHQTSKLSTQCAPT